MSGCRALLLALLVVITACTPGPHPLTEAEAERLALMRFRNYTTGLVSFTARVPVPSSGALLLDGRLDFVDHLGHATLRTEGRSDPDSTGQLQWNLARLAFNPAPGPLDPPPTGGWTARAFQRSGSELDGALRVLLNLAGDRPDNAQLLRQSAARWLRADSVDGVDVDVFEGPGSDEEQSRLRYWVDADNTLRRVEARLGSGSEFAVVDFRPADQPITRIPELT